MNLQAFYSQPFAAAAATPVTPPTSDQMAAYQQWYQQQYAHYVNHYMAYMNSLQQQQQWTPGTMPVNYPTVIGGGGGAEPEVAAAEIAAAAAPAQPQQQPRFPLLVHEPERPERDWLDHVNTICRISFLLLMIYFYSSALRFAIVMLAIFAVFLYRNRRAFVNRLDNNNQMAAAPPVVAAPAQPPPRVDENAGENVMAAGEEAAEGAPLINPGNADHNNNVNLANRNATTAAGTAEEQNNAPTTVLSFLRTFVTTFFTSLLPEPAMAP